MPDLKELQQRVCEAMGPDRIPPVVMAPATCPVCGARTVEEANGRCQQKQDVTGDYECPAGMEEDDAGNLTLPTSESLAAIDAAIERLMETEEGFGPHEPHLPALIAKESEHG